MKKLTIPVLRDEPVETLAVVCSVLDITSVVDGKLVLCDIVELISLVDTAIQDSLCQIINKEREKIILSFWQLWGNNSCHVAST